MEHRATQEIKSRFPEICEMYPDLPEKWVAVDAAILERATRQELDIDELRSTMSNWIWLLTRSPRQELATTSATVTALLTYATDLALRRHQAFREVKFIH